MDRFLFIVKYLFSLTVIVTTLTACSGGGGGGGTATTGGADSSFNTSEFQANYGLASIKALTPYDNSATGSGITVAVIDTGIDLTHADLSANISANSTFIAPTTSATQDTLGHGTQVAGIIAALRNSTATHGVAFDAKILSIKVTDDGTVSPTDNAAAIDIAIAQGVKVINMSFGGAAVSNTDVVALQRAVDAGIILVVSGGNTGAAQVTFNARLANCSATISCAGFGITFDAKGLMIAVGASNTSNTIASISNLAGDTASAFLLAPGIDIVTTALGGGTTTVSGTSFSAPHVSGAVALILQKFPTLSAAQAVSLLLSSATDLSATGTDTTNGVGLLNLKAAFAAQGILSIPTSSKVSGSSVSLSGSQLLLGSAFGNALSGQTFLAEAIILDAYQRAYVVDLRNRIVARTTSLDVMPFLEPADSRVIDAPLANGLAFNFDLSTAHRNRRSGEQARNVDYTEDRQKPHKRIGGLRISGELTDQTSLALALRSSPLAHFGEDLTQSATSGLFVNNVWARAPQLSMLGRGSSVFLRQALGHQSLLTIGFHHSNGSDQSVAGQGALGQARLHHQFRNGLRLGFGAGYVAEKDALFRSTSTGAFGGAGDTQSQYYSISAAGPVANGITVFADYTEATAQPAFSSGSIFSNWSRVRANSFAVGITRQSVYAAGDRLGLTLRQPLRVRQSSADVTLPVARDLAGNVIQQTQRLDLEPDGQQLDIQLAYRRQLGTSSHIRAFSTLSLQPGHARAAEPQVAVGVKWGLTF